MEIPKGKFIRLNDYCIIGHPRQWSEKDEGHIYVIGICQKQLHSENEYEPFGVGNTLEEALIDALATLSSAAMQGLSFEILEDFCFLEIAKMCAEKKGSVGSAGGKWKIKATKENTDERENCHRGFHSITLYTEDDECCGVAQ